ncbi:hypothetical protein [uncultured Duncaniella sp.]|uniref:hypothetical protein n=1 Tax=uncultured Duncaniella sp. TaxID=2768039 RepID=UPI00272B7A12|nr:hypothetical protein [uncultured Duncaniella sp.]
MALYKFTVTRDIYCSGGVIPRGASVEVPGHNYSESFDYEDIKDAFERKYGLRPNIQGIQLNCKRENL